jgi:RHS repeat-associated protein
MENIAAYWLLKWQFTNNPPALASSTSVEDPDTDRDDLVNPGVDLNSVVSDTGTIVYRPEQDQPYVAIPLASTPSWCGGPQVHAYLSQGGTTNLPYQYLIPNVSDNDGPYQAYSLATCILESGVSPDGTVKRVSVLRPRGNVVIFDFPWDDEAGAFSSIGYPIGINSNRTYVLRDETAGDGSLRYNLAFASGITHQFNGGITNVLLIGGLSVPVATNGFPGGTVSFPDSASDAKYNVALTWLNGVVSHVTYASKDNSKTIEASVSGDGAENITALSKSGDITGIGQASASVSGNTITYGWGTVTRIQTTPAGQARTVTITTTPTGFNTITETTGLNDANRIVSLQTAVGGNTAGTTVEYNDSAEGRYENGFPKCAKVQSITFPDLSSVTYTYDEDDGNNTGWLLTETSPISATLTRTVAYSYSSDDSSGDDADPANVVERPRSVTVSLNDTPVAKTMYAYTGASETIIQECVDATADWDAEDNLETTIASAVGGLTNGLPLSSDGPVVSSTWSYGVGGLSEDGNSFNAIGFLSATEARNTGVTISNTVNTFGYSIGGGTRTASSTSSTAYDTSTFSATSIDAFGHPLALSFSDRTSAGASDYCLWGPQSITRRDLTTAGIQYDSYGNANLITEQTPSRTTTVTSDPLGLQTTRTVVQGGVTSTTTLQKNLLGQPVSYSDPLATISWGYVQNANGGWTITQSRAGFGNIVTETYADGSVSKIYGAGAQQCVGYALSAQNGQAVLTTTALNANGAPTTESATVACNALGQPVSAQQAGVGQAATIEYTPSGLPWRFTDESGVRSILDWDAHIGIAQMGVKLDNNDDLSPAGTDKIVQFGYSVDANSETRTAATCLDNNSAVATPLLAFSSTHDGSSSTIGFAGQTSTVAISDFTAPATFTADTLTSDGTSAHESYAPSGQIFSMNLLDSLSGTNTQITVSLEETANGQIFHVWNSAQGSENISFDTAGRIVSDDASASGGQSTTVGYLAGSDLPNLVTGGGKTWRCQYFPNGLPSMVSASGSPTVQYSWDTQARLHTLTLNQSGNQSSVTTWNRDAQTGRLTSKTVNGTVAESYTWKPNGQTDTVTRSSGTVAYQYNTAGDRIAVVDTPTNGVAETITIANNRMGQAASSTIFGGVGEAYTRRVDGSLASVQVTGGVTPNYTLDLPQKAAGGQALGFTLTSGGQIRNAVVSYNAASLVTNFADGAVAAAYAYTPGQKAGTVNIRVNGTTCLTLSNAWNEALGVRSNMAYSANGVSLAFFAFSRGNGTNQITKIMREDGSTREISYDDNGRLAGWKYKNAAGVADYDRSWLYKFDDAGNLIAAGHDPAVVGGPVQMSPLCKQYATQNIRPTSTFTVDAFNFHTVRSWNAVDLVCYAVTNARVTVNGMSARQNGTRFVVSIPLAQNSAASVTNLTVCAVMSTGTNSESYFTNTVQLALPAFPETIETMLASAVTSDSMMEYLYDERNQLRRVTDKLGATAIRLQSTFDYYPDGRRARKTVTIWDGSTWQPYRTVQYIWDRWNLVREIVQENGVTTTRDYAWGLDLAGLQDGQWGQKSGGIGGLLAITEVGGSKTNIFLPICDHIGTVHALVAAVTNSVTLSTPAIVAQYEYSPWGELIAQDGPYANSCPILFMSKYRDQETGLIYFGYRYYDPRTGTWLTTDPLGEQGGLNLTAFVGGDPVNNWDAHGEEIGTYEESGWTPRGYSPYYYGTTIPETAFAQLANIGSLINNSFWNGLRNFDIAMQRTGANDMLMAIPMTATIAKAPRALVEVEEIAQAGQALSKVATVEKTVAKVTQVAVKVERAASRATLWKNGFPGIQTRQFGDWWVKRINPDANAFLQWWGRQSINAQSSALKKLGDMAAPSTMRNGNLFVQDVGQTFTGGRISLEALNPTVIQTYLRASARIGPINDVIPRNMGVNGVVFDPALDWFSLTIFGTGTGGALWGVWELEKTYGE